MSTELIILPGERPVGYAEARVGRGRALHIAGQVGWKAGVFEAKDLVGQFAQAIDNILAILAAAHGHIHDIAEMTIYATDVVAYRAARRDIGKVWREKLGTYFPAMALLGISALVEPEALVEIQCVAYLEHDE
ncbi:MAG TPA: RidA family protein [Kofleriaceae bacterium]|jgi:enamine deaminase RidA (YjgF/YER057c/UK114 family)